MRNRKGKTKLFIKTTPFKIGMSAKQMKYQQILIFIRQEAFAEIANSTAYYL